MDLLPEDIVIEIVVRVPVKPLFRFKCVSKRYESIISRTKLAELYLQRAYSCPESWSSSGLYSALLFPRTDLSPAQRSIKDLNSSSIRQSENDVYLSSVSSLPNYDGTHTIVGSNNGLILSVSHDLNMSSWWRGDLVGLCVSNPLTKQCVQLPDSTLASSENCRLDYALVSRRNDTSASLLSYKVLIIELASGVVHTGKHLNTTVEIFSSDTGKWVSRELMVPGRLLRGSTCWGTAFSYKGILHCLDRGTNSVITYDPFDSPDRFGSIQLPSPVKSAHYYSSLISSGDHGMPRYCEVDRAEVDSFSVWRLLDNGEWCAESKFVISPRLYLDSFRRWTDLMVAPYPWNRHLVSLPLLLQRDGKLPVMNLRLRKWWYVKVELETEHYHNRSRFQVIPIVLCPWSSPYYSI